jgi:hypothetical protein
MIFFIIFKTRYISWKLNFLKLLYFIKKIAASTHLQPCPTQNLSFGTSEVENGSAPVADTWDRAHVSATFLQGVVLQGISIQRVAGRVTAAKDGEGRRRGAVLSDRGRPAAEPSGGVVVVPTDPAGAELAGATAGTRGAVGEEGGVPRHLPLRRRGGVDPQHPGPHGRRAPHLQPRPPPLAAQSPWVSHLFLLHFIRPIISSVSPMCRHPA